MLWKKIQCKLKIVHDNNLVRDTKKFKNDHCARILRKTLFKINKLDVMLQIIQTR